MDICLPEVNMIGYLQSYDDEPEFDEDDQDFDEDDD